DSMDGATKRLERATDSGISATSDLDFVRVCYLCMMLEYTLKGLHQKPIHILRALMFPSGIGVLDRQWLVTAIFSGVYDHCGATESPWQVEPFPEYSAELLPWRLSGERLVERSALLWDLEETIFQRLVAGSDTEVDFEIHILDSYEPMVYTSDKVAYEVLSDWFLRTSLPDSSQFFI
ncbi:MAG TPA: hypothetical protein VK171_01650, partial [Fimbriimonas sp.]|nr:hypothetical protein [Fimbriimonas sp.]